MPKIHIINARNGYNFLDQYDPVKVVSSSHQPIARIMAARNPPTRALEVCNLAEALNKTSFVISEKFLLI